MRGFISMVMVEAGGKERGGEEEGGGKEGVWRREWTAMEDMLLVYWCCALLGGGRSEPVGTMGSAACGRTEVMMSSTVRRDIM